MEENKVTYPRGVVNKEAYDAYLDAKEKLEKHANRFRQTSSGIVLDFLATVYVIKKQIKNLPSNEQEDILKTAPNFRQEIAHMSVLKRKAFNTLANSKEAGADNTATQGLGPLVERQTEILELFGRFYNATEVHRICTLDWGYSISLESINRFKLKNLEKISELQKEYEETYSDIRLGKKRSRLEELSWIYAKTKDKYISNEAREDAKLLQSLLESIKKEVDGDLVINAKVHMDIEASINMQVQQDMMKDFNITSFIISKIAGKLNINAMFLISRLARSQYAKFTGFGGATKDQMNNDEIYSITGLTYDFNQIESLHQKQQNIGQELKLLPNIEAKKMTELDKIREKLQSKNKGLKKSIDNINTQTL